MVGACFVFCVGYHVLGSKAINYSPGHAEQVALVFALYRELSASLLMALLAYHSVRATGQSMMIERRDWPRFLLLVSQGVDN